MRLKRFIVNDIIFYVLIVSFTILVTDNNYVLFMFVTIIQKIQKTA